MTGGIERHRMLEARIIPGLLRSIEPGGMVDLLFRFLRQNKRGPPKWGRGKEFAELTDEEVAKIEVNYSGAFPR
jgi:hypothetical protein